MEPEPDDVRQFFVSSASHELRTPITLILGEIELCLLQERDKSEYIKTLKIIQEEMKSLSLLSDHLIELAQTSYGSTSFETDPVRIDGVLLEARMEVLKRNNNSNIFIHFDNLPEDESYITINGSEQLLKTAFKNLIGNACKFSDDHSAHVYFICQDHQVIIKVEDQGIGIPEQDLPMIFEPFYRGSNARRRPGHGLGLSLTQKIVLQHSGQIEAESVPGGKTIFTVTLPIKPV